KTYQYLSDGLLVNEFKIPKDYTQGFRYFLTDNPEFLKIMKTEHKDKIISEAFSLLEDYKKMIPSE
ncbi:MAG: hypothetical protein PHC38_13445, partial [Weeksellaceae bacterium]|nr:hypothetical protein [Weeksellaceae bacterium]